jgi:hypothetical protein
MIGEAILSFSIGNSARISGAGILITYKRSAFLVSVTLCRNPDQINQTFHASLSGYFGTPERAFNCDFPESGKPPPGSLFRHYFRSASAGSEPEYHRTKTKFTKAMSSTFKINAPKSK